MAIPHTQHDQAVANGQAHLVELGKLGDDPGALRDTVIIEAIRERGWEPIVTSTPGDWTVEAEDLSDRAFARLLVTYDEDRTTALLRSLGMLRYWVNRQEGRRTFDKTVRQRLGISGDEFLRRWDASELDPDDIDTIDIMMMESFGR